MLALITGCLISPAASAQLAMSANDGKVRLDNGVVKNVANNPDTVAIIDLGARPPRLIHEIEVPSSIVGPPSSVAVAPDRSFALVTSNMKLDPADPSKQTPDNRMSVDDLKSNPPAVIATVEAGRGPAGVAIGPKGNIALVANREEGTVSVFAIDGKSLTSVGKVDFGNPKSGPSGISISPDGLTALVTRDGDSRVSALAIDRDRVEYTKRDMFPGQRPYGIEISRKGNVAAVANIGAGQGDSDTISLIDMTAKPMCRDCKCWANLRRHSHEPRWEMGCGNGNEWQQQAARLTFLQHARIAQAVQGCRELGGLQLTG